MRQADARPVLASTGLFTPPHKISNDELVGAYNAWATRWNEAHADEIAAGTLEAKALSSSEFIEKASGIRSRFVMDRSGILDVDRMSPRLPRRADEELSILAEMAVKACEDALARAGRTAADVDAVIVACSNLQRSYPAIAIEVQNALGVKGWGFDMNVACSSATFGLRTAADMITAGSAKAILVVNPEICSAHLNFKDRDCHFIFGDVATAMLVERADLPRTTPYYEILGAKLETSFSNNIRNNLGFLNRAEHDAVVGSEGESLADRLDKPGTDLLFVQEGRKVFKDIVPLVARMIVGHMDELGIEKLDRMWLHQANLNMNRLIATKVLGREPSADEAPVVLDRYANTSSAGSVIALHLHGDDLAPGAIGLLCSFGAGYSAGTVFLRKTAS
ncbi:MAG: beta-ketoacyl-ACP synthase III [Polyangiales bacterium]